MKTKPSYIINIPIVHGEFTIVTSDHAEATMRHCGRLANAVRESGVNVLAINCGMSDKRFRSNFYDEYAAESFTEPRCIIKSSVCGNLVGEREAIDQIVDEGKIGVVILSGWEFASGSYRRRERLINYLRELMDRKDVAVVIYTHIANAPVAGMIDHGGIGKLCLLAYAIAEIESTKLLEKSVKKMRPVIVYSHKQHEQPTQRAQLTNNEINMLKGAEPKAAPQVLDEERIVGQTLLSDPTFRSNPS